MGTSRTLPTVVVDGAGEGRRERVLVALTGHPRAERLVRRGSELAGPDGSLLGVHVTSDAAVADELTGVRRLLTDLGGELRQVVAADVADALLAVARAEGGTQILLGASRRSRWERLTRGSIVDEVIREAGAIDVHVISDADGTERPARIGAPSPKASPLPRQRKVAGWLTAAVLLPGLTLLLVNTRDDLHLPSVLLLYLLQALAVALVGGALPALTAAVGGLLLADYFFTEPVYELSVAETEEVVALVVYLAAASVVSVLVDRVARLRQDVARSTVEAEAMATLAGSLTQPGALPEVLAHLRATFGLAGVALFREGEDGWELEASDGTVPSSPDRADVQRVVGHERVLALSGGPLRAAESRVLVALAAQVATAVEAERLLQEARRARDLEEADDLRRALLQAVSHDLRSPLAGIKASVTSLRDGEVAWDDHDEAEFLRTIDEETDRLDALVANLLDMSRIQAGAVRANLRPVVLDEVVPSALAGLGPRADRVELDLADGLTARRADPVLLERVVANLVDNALNASPDGQPILVTAESVDRGVEFRVVDHGHGIATADRDRVFAPFQRTTDHGTGVGLGLAITRGFLDAMGAEIDLGETDGGGTTVRVLLPDEEVPA
jgi:two-component system sensor histidine kinase KdpD